MLAQFNYDNKTIIYFLCKGGLKVVVLQFRSYI